MRVRSFQLGDAAKVKELLQIALSKDCYQNTVGPLARQLSWDCDLIRVAEEGNAIIGVLIGTIDHNKGCIYRIAVHPNHRRQGVGTSLIKQMEQWFHRRNITQVWVAGDEHNKAAMPLYKARGYGSNRILTAFQHLSIVAHG